MPAIKITVRKNEIGTNLRRKNKIIIEGVSEGLDQVGKDIVRYIKYELLEGQLVKKRTGKLQSGVYYQKINKLRIRISLKGAHARIGELIDQGIRKTWIIRARRKRRLAFVATGGPMEGLTIYPKSVTHPGIRARHFIRKGAEANRSKAAKTIAKSVQKALRSNRRG